MMLMGSILNQEAEMTKQRSAKTEWTGVTGAKIEIEARLDLSRIDYADGWNIEVPCCQLYIIAKSGTYQDLQIIESPYKARPRIINLAGGKTLEVMATIGKIGLTTERMDRVNAIIAEVCDCDEWRAHLSAKQAAVKTAEDAAKHYAKQIRNGLCLKCGSYCYGDCEASR